MLRKGRRLDFRVLEEGEVAVPVEDGKGVRDRVEEAGGAGARPAWKPAPDHPWRCGVQALEADAA